MLVTPPPTQEDWPPAVVRPDGRTVVWATTMATAPVLLYRLTPGGVAVAVRVGHLVAGPAGTDGAPQLHGYLLDLATGRPVLDHGRARRVVLDHRHLADVATLEAPPRARRRRGRRGANR